MKKDNTNALKIAILCGGSGTRLFPISRELMPKQFVPFFENTSLFQQSVLRNAPLGDEIFIITNEAHYFLARDNIEQILRKAQNLGDFPPNSQNLELQNPQNLPNSQNLAQNSQNSQDSQNLAQTSTQILRNPPKYILECISKNTAAALLFVALQTKKDSIILALPSDHIIKDLPKYECAINDAKKLAGQGKIVLFGIKPSSPNTGYGYISDANGKVEFFEKPDSARAKQYVKSGKYFWNSGMFCFQAGALLDEFRAHKAELLKGATLALNNAEKNGDFTRLKMADCEALEDISIDYAIMEKSQNLALLKADFEWSDVGSFDALGDEFPKDDSNNAHNGEVLALDSANNFVLSDKLTAMVGVNDLIVADTADCLLISKRGESQKIKEIVKILKAKNSEIVKIHNIAYRPWGSYQVLLEGANYKIKQIIVQAKKRLSLQKHFHRNEHWIVVSGSAIVSVDGNEFMLRTNESTYIPMGSVHRLSNEGKIPLVIIEVQVGEYLGEDDIVRLNDDFYR